MKKWTLEKAPDGRIKVITLRKVRGTLQKRVTTFSNVADANRYAVLTYGIFNYVEKLDLA